MGVVLVGSTSAIAAENCPNEKTGWTKVDNKSGEASGEWGTLDWGSFSTGSDPKRLDYVVNAGYVVDVCVKSGENSSASGEKTQYLELTGATSGNETILQDISHVSYKVREVGTRLLPEPPEPTGVDCDTDGALVLPQDVEGLTWTIQQVAGTPDTTSPYGPGVYRVTVASSGLPFPGGDRQHTYEDIEVPAATGDCPTRTVPVAPPPSAPGCATDGSLSLPTDTEDLVWTAVRNGQTADAGDGPFGPGVYDITVTSKTIPFDGGDLSHTFENITVPAATGNCTTTTTTTVSEERSSCALGLERRTGTVTTVNGQAQSTQWGAWTFVRGLNNAEFEQLGCRADQPEPVELLGAETRLDCTGVQQRESTQVTTFEWNESTREYEQVVGTVDWSEWVQVRNLTNKELRAEGCVLGEETLVPKPKPEQKPTVKGVERVAPPAAVPTAVAAGVGGGEASSSLTHLMAQVLLGGGLLLLLAGGWVGLGRREAGAHEA